jgi:hypothetical protein
VQLEASHDSNAHAVGRLSLHIGTDGAVDAVHQSGRKFSGVVQRSTSHVFNVDVRFKGCAFADFNRRWNGTLALYPNDGALLLSLASREIGIGKPGKTLDARGTLQR